MAGTAQANRAGRDVSAAAGHPSGGAWRQAAQPDREASRHRKDTDTSCV